MSVIISAVVLLMVADMQSGNSGGGGEPDEFMEVWDRNLEDAFSKIRQIIDKYPFVGMVMMCPVRYTCLYMYSECNSHTPLT